MPRNRWISPKDLLVPEEGKPNLKVFLGVGGRHGIVQQPGFLIKRKPLGPLSSILLHQQLLHKGGAGDNLRTTKEKKKK